MVWKGRGRILYSVLWATASKPPCRGKKPSWPWYASKWKGLCANQGRILSAPTGPVPSAQKLTFGNRFVPGHCLKSSRSWSKCQQGTEGKTWGQGLQELAIQECSRNLMALFLVKSKKRKREREGERKGHSNEHSLKQAAQGFQGIARADAIALLASVSNARTKWQWHELRND